MSRLLGENLKKSLYFFELFNFAKFDIENLISQKPLQLARSSKVGQLIEGNEKIIW